MVQLLWLAPVVLAQKEMRWAKPLRFFCGGPWLDLPVGAAAGYSFFSEGDSGQEGRTGAGVTIHGSLPTNCCLVIDAVNRMRVEQQRNRLKATSAKGV